MGYILPIPMYQYQDYQNRVIETTTSHKKVKPVQPISPVKYAHASFKDNRIPNEKGHHIDALI